MRNRHRERPAGRACCFVTAPCYRWVSCLCSVDVCVHLWLAFVIYRSFTMTSVACGWFFFQRFSLLCDLQKKTVLLVPPLGLPWLMQTWFKLKNIGTVAGAGNKLAAHPHVLVRMRARLGGGLQ